MQIGYVLADFELSYFLPKKKNSLELLNIIFENSSPKGSFGGNKRQVEFLLLSPNSLKLLKTSLKEENAVYVLLYFFIVFLSYILKDTPLFEAANNGHSDIVRFLIERRADVNKEVRVR